MSRDILQPEILPTPDQVINIFTTWRDSPCPILSGIKPIDLFRGYDVDRTWFVGSSAWFPAVMGEPAPLDSDIDIVFSTQDIALDFFEHTAVILKERRPGVQYAVSDNLYGGRKFTWSDSGAKNVIDSWWLPPGHSIAEHVLSFPKDHEHCAILVGASPGEVGALTRIVRMPSYIPQRSTFNYANHKREYQRSIRKPAEYDFES